MQDRPSFDELLEAVQGFLRDDVMPNTQGRVSFHARVASNAIEWIRRELDHEEEHLSREWEGLDRLIGVAPRPVTLNATRQATVQRNAELAERIRAGEADDGEFRTNVFDHLRAVTRDKLVVSNPRLLEEE
jgi:hypothetical protein